MTTENEVSVCLSRAANASVAEMIDKGDKNFRTAKETVELFSLNPQGYTLIDSTSSGPYNHDKVSETYSYSLNQYQRPDKMVDSPPCAGAALQITFSRDHACC